MEDEKAWAGTCRRLVMQLIDGTSTKPTSSSSRSHRRLDENCPTQDDERGSFWLYGTSAAVVYDNAVNQPLGGSISVKK